MNASPAYAEALAKTFVKYALSLLFAVTYFGLLLGTDLAGHFGGPAKGRAASLALVTVLPFSLAYLPLSWALGRAVRRRLEARDGRTTLPPPPPGGR